MKALIEFQRVDFGKLGMSFGLLANHLLSEWWCDGVAYRRGSGPQLSLEIVDTDATRHRLAEIMLEDPAAQWADLVEWCGDDGLEVTDERPEGLAGLVVHSFVVSEDEFNAITAALEENPGPDDAPGLRAIVERRRLRELLEGETPQP